MLIKTLHMGRDNIANYLKTPTGTISPSLIPENGTITNLNEVNDKLQSINPFTLNKESTKADYIKNNQHYVESIQANHGDQIFELNGKGQSPHTLWIGCSDSRAGESCLSTLPGEIFTHRNIANVVTASDISSQGAIQFAVEVLKVKKIIVCGHTDCGGVWASLSAKKIGGVLDLWLNPVRLVRANNVKVLNELNHDPQAKCKKLAELNVIASVTALKRHPSAQQALKNGEIEVWGMMYNVGSGLLSEIEIPEDEYEELFHVHDGPVDGECKKH
jgi:carbonic anhydrase